jgi:RHS repeat-associated protein
VTSFAWDWASGVPEMLSEGQAKGSSMALYLVGHETLGWWDGADWTYYLPDALGSIRQETDGTGAVTGSREWTPFGVEVGTAQEGLGYVGEWLDGSIGFLYLRARWYESDLGRFTSRDPFPGLQTWPQSQNPYPYTANNSVNAIDPSGRVPRPPDVCRKPTEATFPPNSMFWRPEYILRHSDGSRAYYPSWDVSVWWYCGDFGVTAYQFVLEANENGESWYADVGGTDVTVTTLDGATFTANSLFVEDVKTNGTGMPMAEICQEQGNYFKYPRVGEFYCGKGRPFTAGIDDYQVVAAGDALQKLDQIYVPELENDSDPRGNADFVVRDTGTGLRKYQIDVFVGEGPGILSGKYNKIPSSLYTAYQNSTNGVPEFRDIDGVLKLGPLALYEKSDSSGPPLPCLYW